MCETRCMNWEGLHRVVNVDVMISFRVCEGCHSGECGNLILGFLSEVAAGDLRIPLELRQGTQNSPLVAVESVLSSPVTAWTQVPLEARNLCSSQIGGVLRVLLNSRVGPPLEFPQGSSSLAACCRVAPALLQCAGGYSPVLAWDFSSCSWGQLCSCGGSNSL